MGSREEEDFKRGSAEEDVRLRSGFTPSVQIHKHEYGVIQGLRKYGHMGW
jgi:hypothetical protein